MMLTWAQGYYVTPTIITNVADDSRCLREEIFGPVICVVPFDTEEEVCGVVWCGVVCVVWCIIGWQTHMV
jgi:hypothetical protein